ncbi:MAG TPA: hypothetical protein VMH01_01260 [Puia sp.]|nr:hypothetical protein [Puia sp.]
MKITNLLRTLLIVFSASAIFFSGCKKDSNNPGGSSTTGSDSAAANMSSASVTADAAYNDVLQVALEGSSDNNIAYMVSQASRGNVETNGVHSVTGVNGLLLTCATYTLSPADTSTFPKTLTVDFGTGCTSSDGITRKGKVTYVLSGKILIPGTTVSASFTNYFVNGYQLQGTYSITNNSSLAGISYTASVTGGSITYPDATQYNYSGTKIVKMTSGMSTPTDPTDDIYSIAGNASFSSSTGNTLTDSVTTLLSKAYSCRYVGSGVISFTYNNSISGTLDFGTGLCDNLATIQIGNFTDYITLQ